jgi:hypothetical protein
LLHLYKFCIKSFAKNAEIIWLAGNNYRKYLSKLLVNRQSIPMKGLGIGKQLKFLGDRI